MGDNSVSAVSNNSNRTDNTERIRFPDPTNTGAGGINSNSPPVGQNDADRYLKAGLSSNFRATNGSTDAGGSDKPSAVEGSSGNKPKDDGIKDVKKSFDETSKLADDLSGPGGKEKIKNMSPEELNKLTKDQLDNVKKNQDTLSKMDADNHLLKHRDELKEPLDKAGDDSTKIKEAIGEVYGSPPKEGSPGFEAYSNAAEAERIAEQTRVDSYQGIIDEKADKATRQKIADKIDAAPN
jgi:hypothetical protein